MRRSGSKSAAAAAAAAAAVPDPDDEVLTGAPMAAQGSLWLMSTAFINPPMVRRCGCLNLTSKTRVAVRRA